MGFGEALWLLKREIFLTRTGWNGRGMHICLITKTPDDWPPFIAMKTVDGTMVPWVASQTDLLASDWMVLP